MNWVFLRIQKQEARACPQSGSLLLGLDGITVESVEIDEDRTRTVHVLTAADWVGMCPGCADPVVAVEGLGGHPAA